MIMTYRQRRNRSGAGKCKYGHDEGFPSGQSSQRYSATAMSLHWLIALLIVTGFYLGWIMTDIPGFTPTKLKYFSWHKWIGVTVFALLAIRLVWRLTHRAPEMPSGMAPLQKLAAQAVHVILYVLMFVIPASGYLYSSAAGIQVVYLGLVPLPTLFGPDAALKVMLKAAHIWLNYTLLTLVVVHTLAALKHHFIDRDGLLARMIPFLK
jgi:cytochrome b561